MSLNRKKLTLFVFVALLSATNAFAMSEKSEQSIDAPVFFPHPFNFNCFNFNALHCAAYNHNPREVNRLLSRGADVRAQTEGCRWKTAKDIAWSRLQRFEQALADLTGADAGFTWFADQDEAKLQMKIKKLQMKIKKLKDIIVQLEAAEKKQAHHKK